MYRIPFDEDWSFITAKELVQLCIGPYDLQLHFDDIQIAIPEKRVDEKR
jgi:hypothetical protein